MEGAAPGIAGVQFLVVTAVWPQMSAVTLRVGLGA